MRLESFVFSLRLLDGQKFLCGVSGTKDYTLLRRAPCQTPGVGQRLVTPFHGQVNWSSVRGRRGHRKPASTSVPVQAGVRVILREATRDVSRASKLGLPVKLQDAQLI